MIPWQEIETVFLDMDGTLLDLHYDNDFWLEFLPAVYAKKHGLSLDEARNYLSSTFRSTLGTLNFYCVDYWTEQLGLDIVELKANYTEKIRFLPAAEQFLKAIAGLPQQPRVALTTNAHRKVYEIKNRKLGLGDHFDAIYCANEFDAPKESSRYWHKLQGACAFNPGTTLFVDDNQNVLRTAKDYGIMHLVLPLNPDSKRPAQTNKGGFTSIESLKEILPPA